MFGCLSGLYSLFRSFCWGDSAAERLAAGADDKTTGENVFSYDAQQYGFPKDHGTDGVTVAFNESFSPNTIVCYVDASYNPKSVNGIDTAACAGFFGEEHPLNFSILLNVETKKKLSNMDKDARATYLEILATKTALERLFNWKYRPEEVIIRSDSLNMIRGLNLKLKGARFGQIREEILLLMDVASKFQRPILFQHVYGHNGDPGNETADAMARFTMKHGVELEGTMMERDDERTKYCKHPKEISHDERTIPSDPKKQGISRWAKVPDLRKSIHKAATKKN